MRETGDAPAGPAAGDPNGPSADGSAGSAGIRELLGRLAASFVSAADTRVQIAALEFAEERERARDRLVLVLIVALAAAFALLAANALAVALLWDRLGWVSLALLTLLWSLVAGVAGWRLALASRREQAPFSATLAEFGRDRAWLVERFGKRSR
ncbi:MAG: hypothetical protein EHM87_11220 [Burkholderiales bacterium]|nr:MAG: hypothetical protein EHM87_11220 [Burkholderiales bacterium]